MFDEKKIYRFKSFKDFLKVNDYFHGKMVSPGGAASLCGVTRQAINNRGRRGKIRVFKYDGIYGEYVLIPLEDLKQYGVTDSQYEFFKYMKEVQ